MKLQNKKILFVSKFFPNPNEQQYDGKVILNLAHTLMKDFDVTIITHQKKRISYINVLLRREKLFEKYVLEKMTVYKVKYFFIPEVKIFKYVEHLLLSFAIKKMVKKEKIGNFDIIHAHLGYPDGLAIINAFPKNLKKVVTFRSTDTNLIFSKNNLISKIFLKKIMKNAEIISPSSSIARQLKKINNEVDVNIIGNGVELGKIKNSKMKDKEIKDSYKILTVSRLIESKGIQHVIEAIAILKKHTKVKYNIIGSGPYEGNLRSLVEKLDLSDEVNFLGEITNRDSLFDHYSEADVFILPSVRETFGLVYVEAMYSKLPVIAVKNQGIDGVITNLENGILLEKIDGFEISKTLEKLINDVDLRGKLAENAYQSVKGKYEWKDIARQVAKKYI